MMCLVRTGTGIALYSLVFNYSVQYPDQPAESKLLALLRNSIALIILKHYRDADVFFIGRKLSTLIVSRAFSLELAPSDLAAHRKENVFKK